MEGLDLWILFSLCLQALKSWIVFCLFLQVLKSWILFCLSSGSGVVNIVLSIPSGSEVMHIVLSILSGSEVMHIVLSIPSGSEVMHIVLSIPSGSEVMNIVLSVFRLWSHEYCFVYSSGSEVMNIFLFISSCYELKETLFRLFLQALKSKKHLLKETDVKVMPSDQSSQHIKEWFSEGANLWDYQIVCQSINQPQVKQVNVLKSACTGQSS